MAGTHFSLRLDPVLRGQIESLARRRRADSYGDPDRSALVRELIRRGLAQEAAENTAAQAQGHGAPE